MNEQEILQSLNDAQRAAVVGFEKPSLIIAGAGSGKTRVLTSRIAYMIAQGVKPWNILALTFTNKAAAEMRERIEQMIGSSSRYLRMGTFHSVFSRILRENAERIGYPQSFTIYEPNDVKNLLKSILKDFNLSETQYKVNYIASRISKAKNDLITPWAYPNSVFAKEDLEEKKPEIAKIYQELYNRCKRNGAMDFDDLLLQTNILLKDFPDVLAKYQEQYKFILVDEYQDTNYAQYIIIRRLSQLHSRVCVVGDDAQSIYSFRGAKIENILSFRNDYPTAEVFKLEQNYRSTRTIVEAANSVITHNRNKLNKICFSKGDQGDKIQVLRSFRDKDEADLVTAHIRDKKRTENGLWSDFVVLYRVNRLSRVIEESLRHKGIPYRIYKGASFYDHKEIKDFMGYIRLVINPRDDEAFKRIVNYPSRGIGDTTVERIAHIAASRQISMWEAIDQLTEEPTEDAVTRAIVRKVKEFVQLIRYLHVARTTMSLHDFSKEVLVKSTILSQYPLDNSPENTSARENIDELLKSIDDFEQLRMEEILQGNNDTPATIDEWLQNAMLMTDADNNEPEGNNKVTLMTIHSAKGLEYKHVFIIGTEEGIFPSSRTINGIPQVENIEEERRLFYVALTRAQTSITISYNEMRYDVQSQSSNFVSPSRFLREIDSRYIDSEVDFTAQRVRPEPEGEEPRAIDELRRRFDYRFQQQRQQGASGGSFGGSANRFGRPADGESNRAQRFSRQNDPYRNTSSTSYPHPKTQYDERLERAISSLGNEQRRTLRSVGSVGSPAGASTAPVGDFTVGDRVDHALFGVGEVVRIERMAGDMKLVVDFQKVGQKTLLAKFAKLRKL